MKPISALRMRNAAPGIDPYFANVVALLHFDGSDGSTSFPDTTGNSWTANGNAQVDTAQSVFGGASGLFDGTGDYLSTTDDAKFTMGTSNFTVECRVRFAVSPGANEYAIASQWRGDVSNQRAWIFRYNNGALEFVYSTSGSNAVVATIAWSPSSGTWYSIAASRVGSNLYLFIDGTLVLTHNISTSSIFNSNFTPLLGAVSTSGSIARFLNGWIDEFRWTIGTGRYNASYTPAAAAFPDS